MRGIEDVHVSKRLTVSFAWYDVFFGKFDNGESIYVFLPCVLFEWHRHLAATASPAR